MAKRLDILEEKFLNTIKENNLIEKNDVIVVGVSGGPDSIALLECLKNYKEKFEIQIIVAHINHLIRKDSTEDEEFVEKYCEKYNIPFKAKRVEIEKLASENKRGTEEMGRMVRYEFFDEVANEFGANKIAIAHNMNDNAETMLLNLIRGTGAEGLEGIQAKRDNIIRPLINCSREEIENYCEKNNLNPRIDSTNAENIYRRNIIRNIILPQIKELNPNIVETLSRTSKIVKTNNEFIEKESKKIFEELEKEKYIEINEKVEINIEKFNTLDLLMKQRIIMIAIEKIKGSIRGIEKHNIDDICKLAENNVGGKELNLKGLKILVKKGRLIIA